MAVLAALIATPAQAGTWSRPVPVFRMSEDGARGGAVHWGERGGLVAVGETQIPPRLVATASSGSGPFDASPQVIAGEVGSFGVGVDSAGTAVAVFSAAVGLDPGVYYAVRPAGGRFGSNIERLLEENAGVTVHVSPAGETFAVMYTLRCSRFNQPCEASDLYVAVKPAGAERFGPAQQVTAPGGHSSDPVLRFDARGNALIAWLETPSEGESHVAYATRPAGGVFAPQRDIGVDGPDHFTTLLRLDANSRGDLAAALEEFLPGDQGPVVQAATGTVATGLGEPVRLSSGVGAAPRPAIDSRGDSLVAWRAGPAGRRRIDFRVSRDGAEFLRRRTIARARSVSLPTATGGRTGWSVFWRTGGSTSNGVVEHQVLHAGSLALPSLRARRQVLSPRGIEFHRLLTTSRGETLVSFNRVVGNSRYDLYAVSGRAGSGFARRRRIASSPQGSGTIAIPDLIAGPGGRAFAFWHEGESPGDREGVLGAYYRP